MTPEAINEFFSFLYTGTLGSITFPLRLIAGVITSALIAAILVIAFKMRELVLSNAQKPKRAEKPYLPHQAIAQPWQEILRNLESANPADWNLAVIRADAIFDGILKEMGLVGETMGERLRGLDVAKLNALNEVWEAHRIRNRIAHEADTILTQGEARRAVANFEKALREFQYLQE